jgi:predicted molibdopterin-dependent oxidoreductase YjgC
VAWEKIIKNKGRLIIVDARRSESSADADLLIQIRPGADTALLAGMAKIVLEEGLENKKFIAENTSDLEALAGSLSQWGLDEISEMTDVKEQTIHETAVGLATAKAPLIVCGPGILQKSNGSENLIAARSLSALTGCELLVLGGSANYLGCQAISKREGLALTEIARAIPEKIMGAFVIGQDPLSCYPDAGEVELSMKNLSLLVVQDSRFTETAKIAKVVLPFTSFAERDGTSVSIEGKVQLSRAALKPKGKIAVETWCALAKALGAKWSYKNAEAVFKDISKKVPAFVGMGYRKLGQTKVPMVKHAFGPIMKRQIGKDFQYPILLNLRNVLLPEEENVLEINHEDMQRLFLEEGSVARVVSSKGEALVRMRKSARLLPGSASATFGTESQINRLAGSELDPISKVPCIKEIPVRIDKII